MLLCLYVADPATLPASKQCSGDLVFLWVCAMTSSTLQIIQFSVSASLNRRHSLSLRLFVLHFYSLWGTDKTWRSETSSVRPFVLHDCNNLSPKTAHTLNLHSLFFFSPVYVIYCLQLRPSTLKAIEFHRRTITAPSCCCLCFRVSWKAKKKRERERDGWREK